MTCMLNIYMNMRRSCMLQRGIMRMFMLNIYYYMNMRMIPYT